MRQPSASTVAVVLLVGGALVAPVVVRVAGLLGNDLAPVAADCRGFFSDIGVSILVAASVAGLARCGPAGRWLGLGVTLLWGLANFANYEHIRELGAMVGFSYSGFILDPTFVRGSALALSNPLLLGVTLAASLMMMWAGLAKKAPFRPLVLAAVSLTLLVLTALTPKSAGVAGWRQVDFLTAQGLRLVGKLAPGARASSRGRIDRPVAADLGGESIIASGGRASNILLIILEGVSGAYLPSLREHHGATASIDMPALDEIARANLSYSTFVAHQRQTNRGEYSLLCGDYPKLLTAEPKMSELAGSGPLDCLPTFLGEAGYNTVYLQAAPMAFMMKDQFMPSAGFQRVEGDLWFQDAVFRSPWGVDDRSFLEQSLAMIEELEADDRPWFLTLLTVGTHHPFSVPPDFRGSYSPGSPGWALEYLDRALGHFFEDVSARGVLEDTLLIITSDESRESQAGQPDVVNMVKQAWGFAVAVLPSGESAVVNETFMQLDLPISVLDYLGLARETGSFGGRSFFRSYGRPREALWANTHFGLVAGITSTSEIFICEENFAHCGSAILDERSVFSPAVQILPTDPTRAEWLRRAAQRSLSTSLPHDLRQAIRLISDPHLPIVSGSEEQFVFGGQSLTIPARTRIEIEIEAELEGPGQLVLVHDLIINGRQHYLRRPTIAGGERLRLRYSVDTEVALRDVRCQCAASEIDGAGMALDFMIAELRLTPLTGGEPLSGTVEHEFSISTVAR